MQIQTMCPQCANKYDIDEEYEGVEVQCENCGRQFVATRIEAKRKGECKSMLPLSSCAWIWFVFFVIQGAGYLFAALINTIIDAILITFMIDASIIFDVLMAGVILVFSAVASFCAFRFVTLRMIAKRI